MRSDIDLLLSGTSRDQRAALAAASRPIALSANQVLFEEHDQGDALYFTLSGRVELSILGEDGRRLRLDILSQGSVFGEIALFDPGPRTATATALENCRLLQLRHGDLMTAIENDAKLAVELLRLMGQRMRYMNLQINEYVFMPLTKRLARKLLHLRSDDKDTAAILQFSQSELAELAGASREAVSKILSAWKKQGILRTGRGTIELLDPAALRGIAGL